MEDKDRPLLTLEERLRMAESSRAASPEARSLLEEHICEEKLASAMREINKAVTDLYILFVNPYLQMGEYHYERHLNP